MWDEFLLKNLLLKVIFFHYDKRPAPHQEIAALHCIPLARTVRSRVCLILSPTLSKGEGVFISIAPLPLGEAGVWDEFLLNNLLLKEISFI